MDTPFYRIPTFYQSFGGSVPGQEFLNHCPAQMTGYYEARKVGEFSGGQRANFRLLRILDRPAPDLSGPASIVITGIRKSPREALRDQDYAAVRVLGNEYQRQSPGVAHSELGRPTVSGPILIPVGIALVGPSRTTAC